MDKLKEKLSRLMYGRYGIDQLGNFMMWAAVAMMIFGAVVRSSLIYTLALVLIVWADVRIMSKNHSKRYAENQKFLELKNRVVGFFRGGTRAFKDKEHCYFRCPSCHQQVRVPKGKGHIEIRCPKCGTKFIREKMKEHGFENPVLWVYSPVTVDLVDLVPHSALVYDCVDRHSAYGGLMDPALVDRMELELAAKTDRTFATADALAERLRAAQPNTVMIPNGANFERFVQASQQQPVPEDMQRIPHPIFGFVGALQSCIEYDYLEAAAKTRPDWSFVLIGKEKPGVDLSVLHSMPNVHFLGLKPNEQLPQYLAHFDACLNLFAKSDLSKDVSPLKFYEYLATGRPIVSTKQPDQILQYAPLIEIADSPEEFITACEQSRSDTTPERTSARIEAGRACSWDSRVSQMCGILEGQGVL